MTHSPLIIMDIAYMGYLHICRQTFLYIKLKILTLKGYWVYFSMFCRLLAIPCTFKLLIKLCFLSWHIDLILKKKPLLLGCEFCEFFVCMVYWHWYTTQSFLVFSITEKSLWTSMDDSKFSSCRFSDHFHIFVV